MKKLLAGLLLSSSLVAVGSAQAAKVGVGIDKGFGVTAQFSNVNMFLGNDGLAVDYILKQGNFDPEVPVNWFVAVGGSLDWDNNYNHHHADGYWHSDDYNIYAVRVPLGVTFPFAKNWDLYGHLAPALEYQDKPHDSELEFGLDFGFGVRYAF